MFTAHGVQNDRLQRQSAQFIVIVDDVNLRLHPDEVVIPVGLEFGGNFGALFRDEVECRVLGEQPGLGPELRRHHAAGQLAMRMVLGYRLIG